MDETEIEVTNAPHEREKTESKAENVFFKCMKTAFSSLFAKDCHVYVCMGANNVFCIHF